MAWVSGVFLATFPKVMVDGVGGRDFPDTDPERHRLIELPKFVCLRLRRLSADAALQALQIAHFSRRSV